MSSSQDLHKFLEEYEQAYPEDVLHVDKQISLNQDITGLVWEMASRDDDRLIRAVNVQGSDFEIVTNMFASRKRIERMIGAPLGEIHTRYQELASHPYPVVKVETGPILEIAHNKDKVDVTNLPLLTHFDTDAGPYITSGIIVSRHPESGAGNLSYHRATPVSKNLLATSLHSHGDLWRFLSEAKKRRENLPVAMIIGGHPLFMLAASARVPLGVDERTIAGGLLGEPLQVVPTPKYGISVPAFSEVVLEGFINPDDHSKEGPFGEFTGYSSNRSTNNLFTVETIMMRSDPIWLDVVGGNSAEHLNLSRVPREAEMAEKLSERFPSVTRVHYPNSGTHFHCYVAVKQQRVGEARQVILALLGWDPYLKTVVAVDSDVDIADDSQVLWALANHLQPADDLFIIDGLPGSALDPSSSAISTTSRLGLDATRGPEFNASRIVISNRALDAAKKILDNQFSIREEVLR